MKRCPAVCDRVGQSVKDPDNHLAILMAADSQPGPRVEVGNLCKVVVPHDDPVSSRHLPILDLSHMGWNPQLLDGGDNHLLADKDR